MMPETPTTPVPEPGTDQVDQESRRVFEMPPGATPETAQHRPAKRSLDEARENAEDDEESRAGS